MSEQMDEIKKSLAELTETVQEHVEAGDTATLDFDRLEEDIEAMVDAQVAEKMKELTGGLNLPPGFQLPF